MTRRFRLARFGLLGVLGVLLFPGAGSAFVGTYFVSLTPSGPDPVVLDAVARGGFLAFRNTDTVAHTTTFANGLCSGDIAPDGQLDCGFMPYVGKYAYTVDDTTQAEVIARPASRSVSLRASRHVVPAGTWVTLRGTLKNDTLSAPPGPGFAQPIIIAGRPYPGHPHCRIGVVMPTAYPPTKRFPFGLLRWHLRIRPRVGMTYVAVASYQPKGGQVWKRALSKPFRVNVRG
jgi:hypothetical protein